MPRKLSKSRSKSLHLALAGLLLLILAVGFGLWYRADHSSRKIVTVGTPASQPSKATPGQTSIAEKTPSTSNGTANNGGGTDTHGTAVPTTSSNQWTTSASGIITVKSPAPNSKLQDGDVLAGSAKTDQVHYRLSDNKVGMLAQGTLEVSNGNFSGTLHFTPHGTGGRIDIFTTDDQGVEYNEVQINVSF